MTGVVGALVEAWDELRIHKLRVLLALIGVACAVTAITGVTAVVSMLSQSFSEQQERQTGRSVTITFSASPRTESAQADTARLDATYRETLERYGIEHASRRLYTNVEARFPGGTQPIELQAVDAGYGTLMRLVPDEGRWFTGADDDAYAPALVVNETFLRTLGHADLSSHPTVEIGGDHPVLATVVGVTADPYPDVMPSAFVLYGQYERWLTGTGDDAAASMGPWQPMPELMAWVPREEHRALQRQITRDVQAAVPGFEVWSSDNDWDASMIDGATKWVGIGVGGFALLLGGLGLVNIALVTVRHRIREIGIRRSFGATSSRVFFGVMLESVVATVVAGLVGVVLAVAIVKNIPVERVFGGGIQDMPPFPFSAAAVGMAAATFVGALAGLIPALFAVRVKVIDAIRY
jgi:putative ABC transport system permease protein